MFLNLLPPQHSSNSEVILTNYKLSFKMEIKINESMSYDIALRLHHYQPVYNQQQTDSNRAAYKIFWDASRSVFPNLFTITTIFQLQSYRNKLQTLIYNEDKNYESISSYIALRLLDNPPVYNQQQTNSNRTAYKIFWDVSRSVFLKLFTTT